MSSTLDIIKQAYAMAAADVLREDGTQLPAWDQLPPGYRHAFISVFTAANWNAEKLAYELRPIIQARSE
jgi:hypothetical protein